jgi:NAD(P)-dependent dehydrogenase (short-subunit alcohol dehydrogenase family)
MNNSKVWYITGSSQGLGLTLVKKLLENGYRVAATSRNAQALKKQSVLLIQGVFFRWPLI